MNKNERKKIEEEIDQELGFYKKEKKYHLFYKINLILSAFPACLFLIIIAGFFLVAILPISESLVFVLVPFVLFFVLLINFYWFYFSLILISFILFLFYAKSRNVFSTNLFKKRLFLTIFFLISNVIFLLIQINSI